MGSDVPENLKLLPEAVISIATGLWGAGDKVAQMLYPICQRNIVREQKHHRR
jgi:hypothetical protein